MGNCHSTQFVLLQFIRDLLQNGCAGAPAILLLLFATNRRETQFSALHQSAVSVTFSKVRENSGVRIAVRGSRVSVYIS